MIRARAYQTRIVTLLVRWRWTGDARYRRAALAHLRTMQRWRYWSWILWRRRDARPDGIFDLSYGENSATLAMAWDLLHPTLTAAEKEVFIHMVRTWPVAAFYANAAAGRNRWFGKPDSNWNTASGLVYVERPLARFADVSFDSRRDHRGPARPYRFDQFSSGR